MNTFSVSSSGDRISLHSQTCLLKFVHATGLKYCEHLPTCPHLDNPAVCCFSCCTFSPYLLPATRSNVFVEFLERCDFWLHAMCLRKGTKSMCSDPRCTFFVPCINLIWQCVCVFRSETFGDFEGYLWLFSSVAPDYGRQKWGDRPLCWCRSIFWQLRFSSLICVLSVSDNIPRLLL